MVDIALQIGKFLSTEEIAAANISTYQGHCSTDSLTIQGRLLKGITVTNFSQVKTLAQAMHSFVVATVVRSQAPRLLDPETFNEQLYTLTCYLLHHPEQLPQTIEAIQAQYTMLMALQQGRRGSTSPPPQVPSQPGIDALVSLLTQRELRESVRQPSVSESRQLELKEREVTLMVERARREEHKEIRDAMGEYGIAVDVCNRMKKERRINFLEGTERAQKVVEWKAKIQSRLNETPPLKNFLGEISLAIEIIQASVTKVVPDEILESALCILEDVSAAQSEASYVERINIRNLCTYSINEGPSAARALRSLKKGQLLPPVFLPSVFYPVQSTDRTLSAAQPFDPSFVTREGENPDGAQSEVDSRDSADEDDDEIIDFDNAERYVSEQLGGGTKTRAQARQAQLEAEVIDLTREPEPSTDQAIQPQGPDVQHTDATLQLEQHHGAIQTLFVHPFPISSKSLASLLSGGWINDEIVNPMFRLISRCHPRTWALSSHAGAIALARGSISNMLKPHLRSSVDLIIAPIFHSSHWGLLVVHMDTKLLEVVDSLRGTLTSQKLEPLLTQIRTIFPGNWTTQWTPSYQQTNGNDCGVITIAQAIRAVHSKDHLSQLPLGPVLRHEIFQALINKDPFLPSMGLPHAPCQHPRKQPTPPAPHIVVVRQETTEQGFQQGVEGLHRAPTYREAGVIMLIQTTLPVEPTIQEGITISTRQGHLRSMRLFQQFLMKNPQLQTARIPFALALAARKYHHDCKWKAGTALKFILQVIATLQRLDEYTPLHPNTTIPRFDPINLMHSYVIKDCLRYWQKKAHAEMTRVRPAVTPQEIRDMLKQTLPQTLRSILILAWATAGRPSNVMMLNKENVQVQETGALSIHWTAAKTVAHRGPYTTPSHLGPFAKEIHQWLQSAQAGPLFPNRTQAWLKMLRKLLLPGQDLRALRRGALLTLAASGLAEEELLVVSGHSSTRGLHRYLRFNCSSKRTEVIRAAAQNLW